MEQVDIRKLARDLDDKRFKKLPSLEKVLDGLDRHSGEKNYGCWNVGDLDTTCPYYIYDECGKLLYVDAFNLLKAYDEALRLMVYQYCTLDMPDGGNDRKEIFHNRSMVAGEYAFHVLGLKNGDEVPEGWID